MAKRYINILDYIPFGQKNAVRRTRLQAMTGLTDRELRRAIETAPELIINLSDGSGYFRPLAEEKQLVHKYYRTEISRKDAEIAKLEKIDGWLRDTKYEDPGELDQMSIFDMGVM